MTKTGVAFPDYILKDSTKRKEYDYEEKKQSSRDLLLPLLFLVLFAVLGSRLFFLQIIKGYYYRYLSDSNRTKTVVIYAPRGIIFDKNGTPLVFNVPGFRETADNKTVLLSQKEAISKIAKGQQDLEVDSLREYPYKESFSHVVGFIGQISKEELTAPEYSSYKGGDIVGKSGIEQQYEAVLKGVNGRQLYEVDVKGNLVRKLGQEDPIPGKNIELTLDAKLQQAVWQATKNVIKGAVVVSTPKGEILALLSRPSFDPNLFTMESSYKISTGSSYLTLNDILLDAKNQPLLDRAISGVYPPGSTFKLVVAASGLENKIIDESYEIEDTGVLKVGAFSFSNWYYTGYGGKDGNVNVVKGIKRSNDIFFYKLAEKIGVDKISQTAFKFGLDKKLGIDLEGEEGGSVPTQNWKKSVIGEQWYLGDTYNYGIGQGFLLTTPLQVNGWTQAIANSGTLYVPHLLKNQKPKAKAQNLLNKKNADLIRQGMIESCSPGGVAWPLYNLKIKNEKLKIDGKNILGVDTASGSADTRRIVIACKTGTAEHGGATTKPHAWITLFAPAFNPEIVVTVLAEESGEGSNVAAPIAKKILEEWFSR
ncbi:MAG: penicillin-binding transpeptidase domain-containing protein [Patescibacteria group bacterium]